MGTACDRRRDGWSEQGLREVAGHGAGPWRRGGARVFCFVRVESWQPYVLMYSRAKPPHRVRGSMYSRPKPPRGVGEELDQTSTFSAENPEENEKC